MEQTIEEMARELAQKVFEAMQRAICDTGDDATTDAAGSAIIKSALQSVRDQALDDAAKACGSVIPLKMIATESDAPWAASKCAKAIRAMKGETK